MFLLGIGEILEEWTHKKSVDDLARSMSLNVGKVCLCQGEQDVLVSTSDVREGDLVRVHMGNIIPFDGTVVSGEAMVNQASLTGESIPVQKNAEGIVYAGTVLEEGELVIRVDQTNGSSRYEKIVTMIEELRVVDFYGKQSFSLSRQISSLYFAWNRAYICFNKKCNKGIISAYG